MSLASDYGRHKGRYDALKEFLKMSEDNLRKSLAREILEREKPNVAAVQKAFMRAAGSQNLDEYHEGYAAGWQETFSLLNRL